MRKQLARLANVLDAKGLVKEADLVDFILKQAGERDRIVNEISQKTGFDFAQEAKGGKDRAIKLLENKVSELTGEKNIELAKWLKKKLDALKATYSFQGREIA